MTRTITLITIATGLVIAATLYAGEGFHMKCQAKPQKAPKTGTMAKPCGYEAFVTFGGGMFFDQITGYCLSCKKFVYLRWTRENLPAEMKKQLKTPIRPHPKPLGTVWDARTGKVLTLYACPTCKGPFLEIKKPDDLKYCPVCNKPHFTIDKNKPAMAID